MTWRTRQPAIIKDALRTYDMKTKHKPVKRLSIVDKVILGLNIFAALALLLSYLAPSTDPRDWSIIAVLGFALPVIIVANILFVIYWSLRGKLFLLISLLSIVPALFFINAYVGFRGNEAIKPKSDQATVRVMQYNVRQFKGIDRFKEDPIQNEIAEVVKDNQPDILNMEEFAKYHTNRDSVYKAIKASMNTNSGYFKAFVINANNKDSTGNVIFSKYPIIDTGTIVPGNVLNTKAIYADINVRGKRIRVFCIHLAAVKIKNAEKSKYLSGKVDLGSSTFIENKLSSAFVERSFQVGKIKRAIENCPYPYILTGDFNDTPNSFAVNELGAELKNAFEEKGSGYQTTYYSKFPLQIDYIFVSPQFDVLNYWALDKKISDHKPVIADIKLN